MQRVRWTRKAGFHHGEGALWSRACTSRGECGASADRVGFVKRGDYGGVPVTRDAQVPRVQVDLWGPAIANVVCVAMGVCVVVLLLMRTRNALCMYERT